MNLSTPRSAADAALFHIAHAGSKHSTSRQTNSLQGQGDRRLKEQHQRFHFT